MTSSPSSIFSPKLLFWIISILIGLLFLIHYHNEFFMIIIVYLLYATFYHKEQLKVDKTVELNAKDHKTIQKVTNMINQSQIFPSDHCMLWRMAEYF